MNPKKSTQPLRAIFTVSLFIALGLFAILLPIILGKLNLSIISNTYGKEYEKFELFGFCASIALIVVAYIELKKRSRLSFSKVCPIILPILVSFNFLFLITEYSHKLYDYQCYEVAAKAIINEANPYSNTEYIYTYPPLPAEILALLYQLIESSFSLLHLTSTDTHEQIWSVVFYFYQCSQLMLIILAYFLCYRFARNTGLKSVPASVIITVLLLLNNPLIRTLKWGQINLWVLNSFLLAVLLLQRYPLLSGLAIALGGHIKLYPLILLLPWGITKQWHAVMASVMSFFSIVLIQTDWGRHWQLWHQFLVFFSSGSLNSSAYTPDEFRNNSLHSFIYNFFRMTGLPAGFAKVVFVVATFAVAAWFVIRFIKREKVYFAFVKPADLQASSRWKNTFRLYGHSIDALALGLLISPSVWEHHYLLAMPIAIWAVATQGYDKPWQVGIGTFLMFGLPTFDVFPFSYNRIVGLLLLLYVTSPDCFASVARLKNKRLFLKNSTSEKCSTLI